MYSYQPHSAHPSPAPSFQSSDQCPGGPLLSLHQACASHSVSCIASPARHWALHSGQKPRLRRKTCTSSHSCRTHVIRSYFGAFLQWPFSEKTVLHYCLNLCSVGWYAGTPASLLETRLGHAAWHGIVLCSCICWLCCESAVLESI